MRIGGLKVIDSNKPLTVHVTANDIKNGSRKDPAGCAVALAVMRQCHAKQARVQ
jgi:hypothetical protein